MEADIIITGRHPRDDYRFEWFWRDWIDVGFSNYFTGIDNGDGSPAYVTIDQVATAPKNNYTIPATSRMPKIELRDLTEEQFEEFMRAYDNVPNDPELAAQFQQLATNGVTVTLTVAAELPPGGSDNARARITYKPVGDFQGNNEFIMPGTEVEIIVKASRIRDDMTWEDTFKGILAHEFTHLKRDSNGRYLDDPATYNHDDETYDNLFGTTSLSSYSNSLDVVSTVDEFGFRSFTGTDGNNHISMLGTDGFAAYTGAGNDMVLGQTGMDLIYVTGGGKKAIIEPGAGHDMIALFTIDSISKVVLTYIGSDLYITSSDSPYAPADDPSAIVVIGQATDYSQDPYARQNAVEILMTADANSIGLYGFWSGESSAQAADQPFAVLPGGELSASMDRMSIFTADSPVSDASFGHAFYAGDSGPAALYEFMIQMALLHAPRDSVWPG